MKFLTDRNLGKLTKWLRILGYDTVIYQGDIGRDFLKEGAREGRVVLTRRRDMAKRNFSGTMFVVYSDQLPKQLNELVREFSLEPDPQKFLTVCLNCNERLREISRKDSEPHVPEYVFKTQNTFRICPRCEKIFWAGTHKDNVMQFLRQHNLIDRP